MNKKKLAASAVLALACLTFGFADDPKPEQKPETKISGRIFADLSSRSIKDDVTGAKTNDSGTGIDVKRMYFGISHAFNANWTATFVGDIGDKGNPATCSIADVDPDGTGDLPPVKVNCTPGGGDNRRYDLFVKFAYLQYTWSPAAIVRVGAAGMPVVGFEEDMWGYRYIENPLSDRTGFAYSADWGVHFLGRTGIVNYAASATNGRGFSDPTRSKSVDFEGRLGVEPIKGLNIAVGGYTGKRGLDFDAVPAKNTATRLHAIVAYANERFRVGASYFTADNWFNVTTTEEDTANGATIYGNVNFPGDWTLLARYDTIKPRKDLFPGLKDTYAYVGVQKKVNKAISLALVVKNETFDGATLTNGGTSKRYVTPDATVWASSTPGAEVKFNEIGLFSIFSF